MAAFKDIDACKRVVEARYADGKTEKATMTVEQGKVVQLAFSYVVPVKVLATGDRFVYNGDGTMTDKTPG